MIRWLLLACGGLSTLGAAPVVRTIAIPDRDGTAAHAVRVLLWPPASPGQALLVYEPGWDGRADENSRLATALAAQGFTVAALDYATPQPPGFTAAVKRLAEPLDLSSLAALDRTAELGGWRSVLAATDAAAVIDQLPEAAGMRLGIFGWSFGGAVALQACLQDARFGACLNMDGWMFGPAADHASPQPYMLMSGTPYPAAANAATKPADIFDERDAVRLRARFAAVGGVFVEFAGLKHAGFSDAGNPPAIAALAGAFFGHALLGQATPLLNEANPFPAVRLTRFAGPAGQ